MGAIWAWDAFRLRAFAAWRYCVQRGPRQRIVGWGLYDAAVPAISMAIREIGFVAILLPGRQGPPVGAWRRVGRLW